MKSKVSLADHFRGFFSEAAGRGGVDHQHDAFAVEQDDAFADGIEDGVQLLLVAE